MIRPPYINTKISFVAKYNFVISFTVQKCVKKDFYESLEKSRQQSPRRKILEKMFLST